MKRLAALLVVAACGGTTDHPAPAEEATALERPRPSPGADLDGPIPLPDRSAVRRRGAAPASVLDLGADRSFVSVAVPKPPRGGAVPFSFGDDRTGWVTRLPEGAQLPSVAYGDERVYVSGGFSAVSFYALDATTGAVQWATTNLEDNGPTAAIYEDDRVIFNTESCTLFALDADTGERLWFKWLGDPTLAQTAVADGLIYAAHPSQDGHRLTAYKVRNGDARWTRRISGELLATPVIHGDAVYASTLEGWTYRFDRKTGKRAWRKRLRATTAPWPSGDELFVSRRDGKREQQVVVSAADGSILREHHATDGGKHLRDVPRNLNSWPAVWQFEGSRPVVSGGVRYVAMAGEVRATDAESGETLWVRRDAGREDERSIGTVALAGPQIVISTRQGQLIGLDIDTGYTLWAYDIGHEVYAEPVVAKGWVYATTTKGYVVALNVADPTLDGWHMFGGNPKHNGPV